MAFSADNAAGLMPFTAADRARARIREEMARRNLSQRDIAARLKWNESRVSKLMSGRTDLTVNDLEGLCSAIGLAMTEVVRDHGFEFCAEMTPTELRFLERYRQITAQERDALMTLFGVTQSTRSEKRGITKSKPLIPKGRRAAAS